LTAAAAPDGLSPREVELLRLVARGLSNREIGLELSISEHTAANHIRSILRKTAVPTARAATYAQRTADDAVVLTHAPLCNRTKLAEQLELTGKMCGRSRRSTRKGRALALLVPERRSAAIVLPYEAPSIDEIVEAARKPTSRPTPWSRSASSSPS